LEWIEQIFNVIERREDKTFYLQTKDPQVFEALNDICGFPKNVLLGITLETNLDEFDTPSRFKKYEEISKAPKPEDRWITPNLIDYVTIEPILDFDDELIRWIRCLSPKFVYIGYDNHNCKLPEPRGEKTLYLIRELSKFTEVRLKTIRPAWWENNGNTVFKRLSDFSSSSRHQVREGGMREMEELVLYGIKVEKAYRYVPWGEIEIVGRHVKTGRVESMSFSDPATRWQVEKELKKAGIEIELINLNSV
jgi:hypothetical protein